MEVVMHYSSQSTSGGGGGGGGSGSSRSSGGSSQKGETALLPAGWSRVRVPRSFFCVYLSVFCLMSCVLKHNRAFTCQVEKQTRGMDKGRSQPKREKS